MQVILMSSSPMSREHQSRLLTTIAGTLLTCTGCEANPAQFPIGLIDSYFSCAQVEKGVSRLLQARTPRRAASLQRSRPRQRARKACRWTSGSSQLRRPPRATRTTSSARYTGAAQLSLVGCTVACIVWFTASQLHASAVVRYTHTCIHTHTQTDTHRHNSHIFTHIRTYTYTQIIPSDLGYCWFSAPQRAEL